MRTNLGSIVLQSSSTLKWLNAALAFIWWETSTVPVVTGWLQSLCPRKTGRLYHLVNQNYMHSRKIFLVSALLCSIFFWVRTFSIYKEKLKEYLCFFCIYVSFLFYLILVLWGKNLQICYFTLDECSQNRLTKFHTHTKNHMGKLREKKYFHRAPFTRDKGENVNSL